MSFVLAVYSRKIRLNCKQEMDTREKVKEQKKYESAQSESELECAFYFKLCIF